MFLLNLPINIKEQAAIERRRRQEQERLTRIFNVKYRTIGIDKIHLDEQVEERRRIQTLEKQRNDAFAREMIRNDLKLKFLEEEEIHRERQCAQQLNDYRRLYQKPETAREWDLNDPDAWKRLAPARIGDDDPRLGPSSAQVFSGEDLRAYARKKIQQEQLKDDFNTQKMIKAKNVEQQRMANLLYDYKQTELLQRGNDFEQIEEECSRAMKMATQRYNEILANEAKIRMNEQRARQTEERLSELANTVFCDMLTENPDVATRNMLDPRRIMVDRWKGMSKDQLDAIRHQQLTQIDERQKANLTEQHFDATWGQYGNAVAKQATIIEQQIEEETRQFCRHLADDNRRLAEIQRERQHHLNSALYRSAPTAAFYEQFNTTSR